MKESFLTRPALAPYLFWTGYWLLSVFILSNNQELGEAVSRATLTISFQALLALVNIHYLIPLFLEKRRYLLYFLILFLLVTVLTLIRTILAEENLVVPRWVMVRSPRVFQFFRFFLALGIVALLSTTYKFAIDRFRALQRKAEIEKEQLESELRFLKAQVNPHFLFNTLNNIYTLAYLKDDNAAPMVMKLAELLRYMLYECQDDKVALEKEVLFLENIVDMQKLKGQEMEDRIRFTAEGVRPGLEIAPLLLLCFLENSFKHGDLDHNPDGKIEVLVRVDKDQRLFFSCLNTRRKTKSNQSERSGIGLANVRKRLDLIYPEKHTLTILDSDAVFEVQLELMLE